MRTPDRKPKRERFERDPSPNPAAYADGRRERPSEPRPAWWTEDADGSLRRALMDCYNG
jgi:hypothetical protein